MRDFQKELLSAFKSNLYGLPSFCRLVMYELFEHTDFSSGKILVNSLDLFARTDFHVDPLRGRAKEEITGDTIRNAFRTIKKAKPDHFIFSTVHQRIVIEMPFIRELYESFHRPTPNLAEVLVEDMAESKILSLLGEETHFSPLLTEEVDSILTAVSSDDGINAPVKENLTNNKQITPQGGSFSDLKQPIQRDFYPNAETIEWALNQGYVNVTNPIEIKRFITYNLASLSRWADYNPVFINWLERAHDNQKSKETSSITQLTRKNVHEQRTFYPINRSGKSTVAEAIADNRRIIEAFKQHQQTHDFIQGEYCELVAIAD